MSDIQGALTALELREAELLSWGAVGAQWTRDEAVAVLAEHGDGESLFADLEKRGLLVQTPTHGYRTRSAETMRLLFGLAVQWGWVLVFFIAVRVLWKIGVRNYSALGA